MMAGVGRSRKGFAWRKEFAKQTPSQWFEELSHFVPAPVKAAFDHDRLPSINELDALQFFIDCPGVYGEILTPHSAESGFSNYVYTGVAVLQSVGERRIGHDDPDALVRQPNCKHYQLRHGTNDYTSRFVSFVRIPIDNCMDKGEISRRRILGRIGEALFTMWTYSIDPTHRLVDGFAQIALNHLQEAYGDNFSPVEWQGLCTHSPLKETLGTADYSTVASSKFEDLMQGWEQIYGGRANVPDDVVARTKGQSKRPSRQQQAAMRADRYEAYPELRELENEKARERYADRSEEQMEDSLEYQRFYRTYNKEAMTAEERTWFLADCVKLGRKRKIQRAVDAGRLTRDHWRQAEADDWSPQDNFPVGWTGESDTIYARKSVVLAAVRAGNITVELRDEAELNNWYATPAFPPRWRADVASATTKTYKSRVLKAFKAGNLTQAQVDEAESNGWRAPASFPKHWRDNSNVSKESQARSTRKLAIKRSFEAGKITQDQFDGAQANDWKAQPDFRSDWRHGYGETLEKRPYKKRKTAAPSEGIAASKPTKKSASKLPSTAPTNEPAALPIERRESASDLTTQPNTQSGIPATKKRKSASDPSHEQSASTPAHSTATLPTEKRKSDSDVPGLGKSFLGGVPKPAIPVVKPPAKKRKITAPPGNIMKYFTKQ